MKLTNVISTVKIFVLKMTQLQSLGDHRHNRDVFMFYDVSINTPCLVPHARVCPNKMSLLARQWMFVRKCEDH